MIDFLLDSASHDISIKNFTLPYTQDESDLIIQRLKVRLLWFKGEWEFDTEYGIPYFQTIFNKSVDLNEVDDIYRSAITTEAGVKSLISYSSDFSSTTRQFTVTATIQTDSGKIVGLSFNL